MKITIDRFEGDFAVVETDEGIFANMPKSLLPPFCREGDIVSIEKEADLQRKQHIKTLEDELFK